MKTIRLELACVVLCAWAVGASCGGSEGGSTPGSGGSTAAGSSAAGTSGSGGSSAGQGGTAAGGSAGSGGTAAVCPESVPADGASCSAQNIACYYENCAAEGRSVAQCSGGSWKVQSSACDTFSCYAQTCNPGQICSITAGGALIAQCVDNPCGSGPITCDCAYPTCTACSVVVFQGGVEVTCNTCPGGGCP